MEIFLKMNRIGIRMADLGTVATGVYRHLKQYRVLIAERLCPQAQRPTYRAQKSEQ
jgi:hypothetical protein